MQIQQVLTKFQTLNTSVRSHTPDVPETTWTAPGPAENTTLHIPITAHRVKHPPRSTRLWHNTNYCFSCGFDVAEWHTITTCPPSRRKPNHQETATKENMMGGSDRHRDFVQLWQDRCPTLDDFNLTSRYQQSNSILSANNCSDTANIKLNPKIVFVILDLSATMHFLTLNTPGTDTKQLTHGALVGLTDDSTTITTHSKKVNLPTLPPPACEGEIGPFKQPLI